MQVRVNKYTNPSSADNFENENHKSEVILYGIVASPNEIFLFIWIPDE